MTDQKWHRREVLVLGISATICGAWAPSAHALSPDAARSHVGETINQVINLITANMPRADTAKALRDIFERQTALAQLARYCAGRYWHSMTETDKTQFTESFSEYIAFVYAGYFREFHGDAARLHAAVQVLDTVDVGKKGILVRSEVRPTRDAPLAIDWLVSDRSGRIAISDLVVEGISLALTQREIVGAMFDKRNGNVALLIADMEREQGKFIP